MTTQYWLVKQEPEKYSWSDFTKDRTTDWDGVRNYQARNNLSAMCKGDQVLFYASVSDKEVQGIATVQKTAYPDPSTEDDRWVAVKLKAGKKLPSATNHPADAQSTMKTIRIGRSVLFIWGLYKER